MIRHGDVNLHKVKEARGKILEHNDAWIAARGEATGSVHTLTADNLIVQRDEFGDMYYTLKTEGKLTHTSDHSTLTIPPGIYRQVAEREIDYFADSVVKKVVD